MMVVASAARRARYCGTVMPPRSWSPRKVFSVMGVAILPARISAAVDLEDAAVDLLREMLGVQEVRDAVEGVVVDQDGAEQRLLGLDVVGRRRGKCRPAGRRAAHGRPDARTSSILLMRRALRSRTRAGIALDAVRRNSVACPARAQSGTSI